MVIEEEYFDDMNLTDDTTFLTAPTKRAKTRFNQNNNNCCDTKRNIREIAINNGWNTQVIQILCEKRNGKFLFRGNFLSR